MTALYRYRDPRGVQDVHQNARLGRVFAVAAGIRPVGLDLVAVEVVEDRSRVVDVDAPETVAVVPLGVSYSSMRMTVWDP
jgi:hypothetical protein